MSRVENPWNAFRKKHAGHNLTLQQLSKLYSSAESSALKKPRKRLSVEKSAERKKRRKTAEKSTIHLPFTGSIVDAFCASAALVKRFENCCIPIPLRSEKTHLVDYFLRWKCIISPDGAATRFLYVPDSFAKSIQHCLRCPDIEFVFGFIFLTTRLCGAREKSGNAASNARNHGDDDAKYSHANAFLYCKRDNSVEIIEPQGTIQRSDYGRNELLKTLTSYFTQVVGAEHVYQPDEFISRLSFQTLQIDQQNDNEDEEESSRRERGEEEKAKSNEKDVVTVGYCVAWCFWWIEYRLMHAAERKERAILFQDALKTVERQKSIEKYITSYANAHARDRDRFLSSVVPHASLQEFYRSQDLYAQGITAQDYEIQDRILQFVYKLLLDLKRCEK